MFRNQIMRWIFFIGTASTLCAHERITDFASSIVIDKNASLTVTEQITVAAEGKNIVHGIVREFPTTYQDAYGNFYRVSFCVEQPLLDGKRVPYHIKDAPNGKMVYIGDANIHLTPGTYTFTITYHTNRQLGFFSEHDELYWNVTGNGWRLPIDKASAKVILPQKINPDLLKVTAYTGFKGEQHQWFTSSISDEGVVTFQTTKKLQPFQGLTIVVGFPKGTVSLPSFLQRLWGFFTDNLHILLYLIGILLMLICFYLAQRSNSIRQGDKAVIPLFYPPEHLTPGQIRYINIIGFDNTILTADIVYMAVQGWVTITYEKSFWRSLYIIEKQQEPTNVLYSNLLYKLLGESKKMVVSQSNIRMIKRAKHFLEDTYARLSNKLFEFNTTTLALAGTIAFGIIVCTFIFIVPPNYWFFIFLITYGALFAAGYYFIQSYTPQGFELKRAIDGFKLFLSTTETERIKMIGSPPTKTPELYEKYLPYAIALGVEQQWTNQFKKVFEALKEQGTPYTPVWYIGGPRYPFHTSSFSSSFTSSFNRAISSSASPPGSSSGFGGSSGGRGGSSGGGGGGGGGGGW